MRKLLIFPFNGNGIEAGECIGSGYELAGFVDDTKAKQGRHPSGFTVFSREAFNAYPDAEILAVPGSPSSYARRKEVIDGLGIDPRRFACVIHPKASVSSLARIGRNVLLMAGAVITSNAVIGDHVLILPNTVIHHDSTVGDFTLIGSNVSVAGNTKIGMNCYIGSGSHIINGVEIGDLCLIGMGANVIRSVPARSRVVGNPARPI